MGYDLGRKIRGRNIADGNIEFRSSYHQFPYLSRDAGESELMMCDVNPVERLEGTALKQSQ